MSNIRITFTIDELDTISLALSTNNSIIADTIKLKIGRARLGLKKSRAGVREPYNSTYNLDSLLSDSIPNQLGELESIHQEQEAILQAALSGSITSEQRARYQELTGLVL